MHTGVDAEEPMPECIPKTASARADIVRGALYLENAPSSLARSCTSTADKVRAIDIWEQPRNAAANTGIYSGRRDLDWRVHQNQEQQAADLTGS
jgi:hypothetical protein